MVALVHRVHPQIPGPVLRLGFAPLGDRDQAANDLLDSFDFDRPPLKPLILEPRACANAAIALAHTTFGDVVRMTPAEIETVMDGRASINPVR